MLEKQNSCACWRGGTPAPGWSPRGCGHGLLVSRGLLPAGAEVLPESEIAHVGPLDDVVTAGSRFAFETHDWGRILQGDFISSHHPADPAQGTSAGLSREAGGRSQHAGLRGELLKTGVRLGHSCLLPEARHRVPVRPGRVKGRCFLGFFGPVGWELLGGWE